MSTINPKTLSGSVHIDATDISLSALSNQIVFGTGLNITINATAPAQNRIYIIADVGTNSTFMMTDGDQVSTGTKSFDTINVNNIGSIGTDINLTANKINVPSGFTLQSTSGPINIIPDNGIVNFGTSALNAFQTNTNVIFTDRIQNSGSGILTMATNVDMAGQNITGANNISAVTVTASSGITTAGLNMSSLSGPSVLAIDSSKNVTTLAYGIGSIANGLVQMSPGGGISLGTGSIAASAVNTGTVQNIDVIVVSPAAGANGILAYPRTAGSFSVGIRRSAANNDLELGVANGTAVFFTNATTGDAVVRNNNSTGKVHLGIASNPSTMFVDSTNVTIPNGGICFGVGNPALGVYTGSSAYSPTMGDGTNNFILTTAAGRFNRVGSLVAVDIWCVWSSKGSATGNLRISLPFTIGPNWRRCTLALGFFSGIPYTGMVTVSGTNSTAFVQLISVTEAGSASTIACSAMATTGELQLSGVFDLG